MEEQEKQEEQLLFKTMIHFTDEGIVISAADLQSIEKDMRFVEFPNPHFEYGIIINRGIEQRQYVKRPDVRDQHFDNMLDTLKQEGIKVINIQ